MNRLRSLILISVITLSSSSCGWQLRGWQSTAPDFHEIAVVANDRYSPLTLALLDTLQQRGVSDDKAADLKLQLGKEYLSKRTVAVTSIGSPSQYEMSLSVNYRFYRAEETPQSTPSTAMATRVFDFDPSNTVAKTEEENTLLTEMRRELVQRILRNAPLN